MMFMTLTGVWKDDRSFNYYGNISNIKLIIRIGD
ncbi:hypothetical protein ABH968_005538 [Lysinibacillus sp. RC79]